MTIKGKMRVYACGGAAVNLTSTYVELKSLPGFAEVSVAFADSSFSNISHIPGVTEDMTFVLEGVDGAGKKRTNLAQDISASIKQLVVKHAPLDFNVVVFSAAGG